MSGALDVSAPIAAKRPVLPKRKAATMSADDFSAFLTLMTIRSGWSARKLGDALGVSENTMATWKRKGAPRHVALACAALVFGLPAWRKVSS